MNEEERRMLVDLAVEAAVTAVENVSAAGEISEESEEHIGEAMFRVTDMILRESFGVTDITRSEVGEAIKRLSARHRARADQHGAMADLHERGAAEIERAAALEGVEADGLTVGEALEIIRRHGEEPDPVVAAATDVQEEFLEEQGEEDA